MGPALRNQGLKGSLLASKTVREQAKCHIRSITLPCGSGRAREEGNAMDGTGFAGVRGHARSHRNCVEDTIFFWA